MDFAASFLRGFEKRATSAKEVFRNLKRKHHANPLNDVSVSPSTGLLNYESKAEKKGL